MKNKKDKKTLRQRFAEKLAAKFRPYVETYVKEHDKYIIDKICDRINFLSLQPNFTADMLIQDLKTGGFENDKEKCTQNN